MKGSRLQSMNNSKAQDTASPASVQPSSICNYSFSTALDKRLQLTTKGTTWGLWGKKILSLSCICKATDSMKNIIKDLKYLTVTMRVHSSNSLGCMPYWLGFIKPNEPSNQNHQFKKNLS